MNEDTRTPGFELDTLAAEGARQRTVAALFGDTDVATKVGGYEIDSILGRGGMGVVYLARDPRLDRQVALKRIVSRRRADPQAGKKLVTEAQQLARVQHPNVVTVFEVGVHNGDAFLVMEYVPGPTLDEWIRSSQRSAAAIRDVFVQAATGLAAAHGAGVLHLDFKPANVLVAAGDVAKVADFGIALFAKGDEKPRAQQQTARNSIEDSTLSHVSGTPAYMAPEQFAGRVSERSDQFAFGVALLEALAGHHPFEGKPAYLLTPVSRRRLLDRIDRARVPSRLFEIACQALELDAAARWPSMHALAKALRPRAQTGRTAMLGLGAVVTVAAATYALTREPPAAPPCQDIAAQLGGAWDADVQATFDQRFAVGPQGAPRPGTVYLREQLDDYANRWVTSRRNACMATLTDGHQTSNILDLRYACLDARREELSVSVLAILAAPTQASEEPTAVLGSLGDVGSCDDIERLQTGAPPPPNASKVVVARARGLLAQAKLAQGAGDFDESATRLRAARSLSDRVDYPPLLAELRLREGTLASARSNFDEAEAKLTEAFFLADSIGHDSAAANAASEMAFLTASRDPRPRGESDRWVKLATASAKRTKIDGQLRHLSTLAAVAHARGDVETALSLFEKAAAAPSSAGPLGAGKILNNTAIMLRALGRHDEAEAKLRESIDLHRSLLGDAHALTASAEVRLSNVLRTSGRAADALPLARHAHGVLEPGQNLASLEACSSLGLAERGIGDLEQGCTRLQACVDLAVRLTSEEHLLAGMHRVNVAACLQDRHAWEEAAESLRRALAAFEAAESPHADVARHGLAEVLLSRAREAKSEEAAGLRTEAEVLAQEAVASIQKRLGVDSPVAGGPLATQGHALLQLGRAVEAQQVLQLAVELRRAGKRPEEEIARTEIALAVARWEVDGHLADLAAAHAKARALDSELADDSWIFKWLATHPLPSSLD